MILYVLGLAICLSAGAVVVFRGLGSKTWVTLMLSGGGAFLITLIFTHVFPEMFETLGRTGGILLLTGFLLQIALESFTRGIEHGHSHSDGRKKTVYVSLVALCVHAYIEGMPLASAFMENGLQVATALLPGIMLHKLPETITLAVVLSRAAFSKGVSLLLLTVLIASTVAGSLTQVFLSGRMTDSTHDILLMSLAVTMGMLLHISTTILFESSERHRWQASQVLAIALGVAAGIFA